MLCGLVQACFVTQMQVKVAHLERLAWLPGFKVQQPANRPEQQQTYCKPRVVLYVFHRIPRNVGRTALSTLRPYLNH